MKKKKKIFPLKSALFQIPPRLNSSQKIVKKKNWKSYIFTSIDQKAVPCCSTLERKFVIVVMDIVGRSEKMEKLREKITWSWRFRELRFVITNPSTEGVIIQNNSLEIFISIQCIYGCYVRWWKIFSILISEWNNKFIFSPPHKKNKIGSQCDFAYVSSTLRLAASESRHSSRSLPKCPLSRW